MGKVIKLFKFKWGNEKMNIFDLAKAFLSIEPMSNKKLQKLCYYAQAWHLALNDEPLVENKFEAWIHGPVCPELYQEYKHYGYYDIPEGKLPDIIANDSYTLDFIKGIYKVYGHLSGDDLEYLTHKELPWLNARDGLEEWQCSNVLISENDMKKYYKGIYEG